MKAPARTLLCEWVKQFFNRGTLTTIREPAAVPVMGLFGAVD